MTAAATSAQIGAIHALKARAGLDDDSYRDFLAAQTGKRSAKSLSKGEAIRVIDGLKALSGASGRPEAKGALRLSGPYAGICRALWLSAWHLGLVRDRTDTALVSFVRRQTGLDSLNWLRDPADARKAIEALKAWIARDGGVIWPRGQDAQDRKLAVIAAQQRMLGIDTPIGADTDLDEAIAAFGRCIRAARET
jgi:phage gp16-like protein